MKRQCRIEQQRAVEQFCRLAAEYSATTGGDRPSAAARRWQLAEANRSGTDAVGDGGRGEVAGW